MRGGWDVSWMVCDMYGMGECKVDGMRHDWSVRWMEVEIEGV